MQCPIPNPDPPKNTQRGGAEVRPDGRQSVSHSKGNGESNEKGRGRGVTRRDGARGDQGRSDAQPGSPQGSVDSAGPYSGFTAAAAGTRTKMRPAMSGRPQIPQTQLLQEFRLARRRVALREISTFSQS